MLRLHLDPPMSRRARAKLTAASAVSIFLSRFERPRSTKTIALAYGISEKTVRDVWNGRTWARVTSRIGASTSRPGSPPPPLGRPLGSKDSRPRKRFSYGDPRRISVDDLLFVWETEASVLLSPSIQLLENPFESDFIVYSISIQHYTMDIPVV